jgi:hypothetical protein
MNGFIWNGVIPVKAGGSTYATALLTCQSAGQVFNEAYNAFVMGPGVRENDGMRASVWGCL